MRGTGPECIRHKLHISSHFRLCGSADSKSDRTEVQTTKKWSPIPPPLVSYRSLGVPWWFACVEQGEATLLVVWGAAGLLVWDDRLPAVAAPHHWRLDALRVSSPSPCLRNQTRRTQSLMKKTWTQEWRGWRGKRGPLWLESRTGEETSKKIFIVF